MTDMPVILSDLALHADDDPDAVAEMVEIVTARGYRIGLSADALFYLVRDPDGAPIIGHLDPVAITIDAHASSDDFRTGLLTGLVITTGRSAARTSVPASLLFPSRMEALRTVVIEALEASTSGARRADGGAFPIYSNAFDGDPEKWEISSRYLSIRVNPLLDETGNRLNQDELLLSSWSTQIGFLTGIVIGASIQGPINFRHAPDVVFVHRYLVEVLGAFGSVELPKASKEVYPRRANHARMPTLTLEASAIERLRRGSAFLTSLTSPAGGVADPDVIADPIVEAYACECPAYVVDLAEGPVASCGFTLAHADLDPKAKASAIEFARSVSTLIE